MEYENMNPKKSKRVKIAYTFLIDYYDEKDLEYLIKRLKECPKESLMGQGSNGKYSAHRADFGEIINA